MWKAFIFTFALMETALGATLFHCHEGTTCHLPGDHLDTTSFEFLSKFTQKQYGAIVSLTMSNASINKVDPKLKYLKNLQYLDLSHNDVQISSIPSFTKLKTLKLNGNNLKYINLTALPQNIETLDISQNLLVNIPRDWRSLKSLKTLHLYKNPVDCDCNNVLIYDTFINSGILVPDAITCHSPKKYVGKNISAVNCSQDDIMLYDEPDLGSGDTENTDEATEGANKIPIIQETDEEQQENNTIIDDKVPEEDFLAVPTFGNSQDEALEEGSGDEGSGFGIAGCIIDCNTPGPIGDKDEAHASPLPSAIDQAKIIFDDLNVFKEETMTSTVEITTSTTSVPIVEPPVPKKVELDLDTPLTRSEDVELIEKGTKTGDLQRASAVPKNSTAIYAIIGIGLFLAAIFMVCFIKKRKEKKRKQRHEIPALGEEMKPLNKTPIKEKALINSSNIPEHIPLINGQNGKPKDDAPVLKAFTPLAHPETVQEEEEEEEPGRQDIQNDVPFDVEVRQKSAPELLTPQRERVTIIETEIPDSIPKTPLLVHRQKNSEGEIVTTLVP